MEFERFLQHARGSLLELETQIVLSGELGFAPPQHVTELLEGTGNVARALNALMNSFRRVAPAEDFKEQHS
jgi:four helix bundle protein